MNAVKSPPEQSTISFILTRVVPSTMLTVSASGVAYIVTQLNNIQVEFARVQESDKNQDEILIKLQAELTARTQDRITGAQVQTLINTLTNHIAVSMTQVNKGTEDTFRRIDMRLDRIENRLQDVERK